jgi:uncharacterized membrane protein YphA (DoxX/SURF4 family)
MNRASFHVLRVGVAVTFLWIGVLIFKDPQAWGGFLEPWAAGLVPVPLREAMIGTAVLDILIGILLLIDVHVWLAALVGSIHLVIVLTVSGITEITVRDLAILAATLALMADALPKAVADRLHRLSR